MCFVIEILLILKAIKSHFKGLYHKQNLTHVVISYEIYETRQRLVSLISYEITTRVRSSMHITCTFTQMNGIVNVFRCVRKKKNDTALLFLQIIKRKHNVIF